MKTELAPPVQPQTYPSAPPLDTTMEQQPSNMSAHLQDVSAVRPRPMALANAPEMPQSGEPGRAAFQDQMFSVSPVSRSAQQQYLSALSAPEPTSSINDVRATSPYAPPALSPLPSAHLASVSSLDNSRPVDPVDRALDDLTLKAKNLKQAKDIYKKKLGRVGMVVSAVAVAAVLAGFAVFVTPILPLLALGGCLVLTATACVSFRSVFKRANKEAKLDEHEGKFTAALKAIKQDQGMISTIKGSESLHKQLKDAQKLAAS